MAAGRTIARNSALLGVAFGVSKLFGVGLTAIAGRVLGPSVFGLYVTGATLVEVGRILASAGLDYLVAREVASEPDSATRVASNAAVVKLVTGGVTWAVLIALVGVLGYPRPVMGVVVILGSALLFENLSDILDAALQGVQRVRTTTVAFALGGATTFASGAAALLGGWGLRGYAACFVLGFVVRFSWTWRAARTAGIVRFSRSAVHAAELRRCLRAGVPLLSATILALLFHRMDLLMLGKMMPAAAVGLYGAAVRIIDVVVLLPRILATATYPALRLATERSNEEARDLAADSLRVSLLLCSLAAMGVWLLAPVALRWIPGAAFVPATPALRLLAWGIVLQGGAHVTARLLLALDAERDFAGVAALSLLCNLALNMWWIPRWGIEGAALATLCSYGLNFGLYLGAVALRGHPLPLGRALGVPLLAVLAAAITAYVLGGRPIVEVGMAMGAAWLATLVALRGLQPDDFGRVRGWIRR